MAAKPRNFFSSFHLILFVSTAFLIAVFSYLILRACHLRLDLSEGKVYSLSPASIQILDALKKEPIRVICFFRDNHPAKGELEELLKECSNHHPDFKYTFYDPDRMPAKAKQYQVDAYETIVIEVKGKQERTRQVSEEAIANLLAKLYRGETKTVYFSLGQNGHSLKAGGEEPAGYELLRSRLEEAHYEVKETVLLRDGIPAKTNLLVLGGPRVDLLPEELNQIRTYLEAGGHVLVLIDPVNKGEGKNLEQFLRSYGIELGSGIIVDKLSKLYGADYLIPLVTDYGAHPVTKGFEAASFFPLARTVRKSAAPPAGLAVSEIAWTGTGSWAEGNLAQVEKGTAEFNDKEDEPGPVPIAAAAEDPKKKWRLVVVGDSDFATNAYLNLSGNRDFILNACAWLVSDEFAISIRPRERKTAPLFLKSVDQQFLFYLPVLGLPILSLGIGTGVFFWRRRYR